jgi:hypothetical protein
MPGRRNLAKERAKHDSAAKFSEFHALLLSQVPSYDRAIIGRRQILQTLGGLGIKRLNGNPLTWRIVKNWRLRHGFPMLAGCKELGHYSGPPGPRHSRWSAGSSPASATTASFGSFPPRPSRPRMLLRTSAPGEGLAYAQRSVSPAWR